MLDSNSNPVVQDEPELTEEEVALREQEQNPQGFFVVSQMLAGGINTLCLIINDWAKKKGWNEAADSVERRLSQIALMHSELSEATEALRAKEQPFMDDKVPELTGEAAEMADCVIRIFHYCGEHGIDLGEAIRVKHEFNTRRPYKHGKKI